jgi:hypothetical protein
VLTLLADATFEFSVGAVLGLGAVAVGYGILKHQVAQLRLDLLALEQLRREDTRDFENRLRDLERWQDRTKGAERARHNGDSTDSAYTKTFSRRNSDRR